MIARALIIFLALFIGYNLVCTHIVSPAVLREPAESQLMRNLIRAEQFLRADPPPPAVLIGTSMSERMTRMRGVMNLSMGGCGPATGLTLLHESGETPRMLLVEANNFPGGVSQDVVHNIFGAIPWKAKLHVPAAGFSYRVSTVLVNRLRQATGAADDSGEEDGGHKVAPELFKKLVAEELENFKEPAESSAEFGDLDTATRMIHELEKRGTRVVFFEMPVHPDIARSPRFVSHREILQREFPPDRYAWIEPPADGHYTTTDGVHLEAGSALAYRDFLLASIGKI